MSSSSAVTQPRIGTLGLLRWAWRQLTSMRTALFLLFLLAIAALPGSYFPQRGVDPTRVQTYLDEHKSAGPWLDRIGMFDVYSSPWFSAVYLLLVVSLLGCVLPRLRVLAREVRSAPPRAPRRLAAMPAREVVEVPGDADAALAAAREVLRGRRFRLRPEAESVDVPAGASRTPRPAGASATDAAVGGGTRYVSAERGYLREVGNLMFHLALLVVILGVAVGHLWGWRIDVIVPAGKTYTNNLAYADVAAPGPLVDMDHLDPFVVKVDRVDVDFETQAKGAQFGQPRSFTARVTTQDSPSAPKVSRDLAVNHPISFGDATVYLLGNGYAPVIQVKDAKGKVVFDDAVVFRPQDNFYTSTGAVKVTGSNPPKQLGFLGVFMPTAGNAMANPVSVFPAPVNPQLLLELHEGTLFPGGRPQSVYSLNTESMPPVKTTSGLPQRILLMPGETKQLEGGRGSVSFVGLKRFAGLQIRNDPGKDIAFAGAVLTLTGLLLSLLVRRRRVFVRASERDGRTLLEVAGLAKGEDLRLDDAVRDLADEIAERLGGSRTTPDPKA